MNREQRESLKQLIDRARRERMDKDRRIDQSLKRDGDLLLRSEPKVTDIPKVDGRVKRQCPWCPKDDFGTEHGRLVHASRMHGNMTRSERKRILAETRLPEDSPLQESAAHKTKPKEEPVSTEIVTTEDWYLSRREQVEGNTVDHPAHYNTGSIEVIDFIEDQELGFHEGNAVKYISRARHKGTEAEDLKKAAWYLLRRAQQIEESSADGG